MTTIKSVQEPGRTLPVLGECDVLVCGGGAAGCAAAVAAARHGADVILVEKDGYLGGATVSQLVGHILSTNGVDFQGIYHDWIRALRLRGGLASDNLVGGKGQYRGGVDPEVVKFAWDDLLEAAGVRQLLHAWCSTPLVEGGVCGGVVAETRAGRRAILAKRVIDCTADGAVCAAAGVPWEQGDGVYPWSQSLTKVFRMGNVTWPEGGYTEEQVRAARNAMAMGVAAGEFKSPVVVNGRAVTYSANNHVRRSVAPYRTEMNVFASRVLRVDPLDPWEMTQAEREGRRQAWECAEAIRRCVPGFEKAYLLDTNAMIGLRDSRRVRGLAVAGDDDVREFRKHADGIARSSWHIDIWPAESYDAAAVDHASAEAKERKAKLLAGEYFDVRYGALVAAGVDNLMVAGRCLSASRLAQASLRIQQTCQSTGQAAGTAAVLSLKAGVTPRELDVSQLVKQLARDRDVEPAFDALK